MRRLIIDTDTGSDDAVALIMALKSTNLKVEAITTVCGNVPVELATKNALMTIEVANGQKPPLYVGAGKPLMRDLVTAVNVHGEDGMGDCNLINPTLLPETKHAVDAILEIIENNPGEIEIVTIGPVTNIALAILKAPETMKKVKRIYSMGTAGFGPGNTTPVAEFNVYVDAEAYSIMMKSGIPISIIGFDICLGEAAWSREDMEFLMASQKEEAVFAVQCNRSLLEYNLQASGGHFVDLPDAVAMGVVLWDDIVLENKLCYCYVCTTEEATYGQVIVNDGSKLAISDGFAGHTPNATICKTIDNQLFKKRLLELLVS
ncbi:nucleoside hydrolase [Peribacillus frigoritolerans]|uniref:nucleoside hydrolase n=1 Tax=Peribacillus frigoritolerans TaxID=450367 RepID=UPI002E1AC6AC|nr:nucleoside hydrolase [Peribacillus frigoritolerans]MED4690117.1 nucleoside hydrolase [Peribacillus frigoritolerans]